MPIRSIQFAPGEHYHLCVRGNNKQELFRSASDRARFLFLALHAQSPNSFKNIQRAVLSYTKTGSFGIDPRELLEIVSRRYVALEAFALMTNHVHLAVREEEERGVVRYMQRVLNAYAKYFNTKYNRVGHLFQGPYRAVHVASNEQLLYLSSYIHKNPRELPNTAGKEDVYEWSSYRDYLGDGRFAQLLDPSDVLSQFTDSDEYREFVVTSSAKEHGISI